MEQLAADWIAQYSYPAVFLLLLSCGFGAPFSEEVITLLGGAIAGRAGHSPYAMMVVTFAGAVLGDLSLFFIGKRVGTRALERAAFRKLFTPRHAEWLRRHFERRGMRTIFLVRFIPGVRAAAFLSAGTSRQKVSSFVIADSLAAAITSGSLTLIGHRFGESVLTQLKIATRWIAIGGGALLVAIALASVLSTRLRRNAHA